MKSPCRGFHRSTYSAGPLVPLNPVDDSLQWVSTLISPIYLIKRKKRTVASVDVRHDDVESQRAEGVNVMSGTVHDARVWGSHEMMSALYTTLNVTLFSFSQNAK